MDEQQNSFFEITPGLDNKCSSLLPLSNTSHLCLLLAALCKAFFLVGILGAFYEFISTFSHPDSSLHIGSFFAFIVFGILGLGGAFASLLIWDVLPTKHLSTKLKVPLAVLGTLVAGLAMKELGTIFWSFYSPMVAFGVLLNSDQIRAYLIMTTLIVPEALGSIVALRMLTQKKQWKEFTNWFLDGQSQQT